MPIIRAGPTRLDFLDQGHACLIFPTFSRIGGYLSLIIAVQLMRATTRKPLRVYLDSVDPVENRLGCVLTWLGARSWDSLDDHRCFEFYLPIKKG